MRNRSFWAVCVSGHSDAFLENCDKVVMGIIHDTKGIYTHFPWVVTWGYWRLRLLCHLQPANYFSLLFFLLPCFFVNLRDCLVICCAGLRVDFRGCCACLLACLLACLPCLALPCLALPCLVHFCADVFLSAFLGHGQPACEQRQAGSILVDHWISEMLITADTCLIKKERTFYFDRKNSFQGDTEY